MGTFENGYEGGLPPQPGLGITTSEGGVDTSVIRIPQGPSLPTGINVGQTVIQSDTFRKISAPGISSITNSAGAQILREEAPVIRVIQTKINEGREVEHNLTAIRAAIHRELTNAKGVGVFRRIEMKRRLHELDTRINQLHGKNQEAEFKLRTFISGVQSGKIRDRRQARSILDNIYHFCGTVVAKLVLLCRGLAGAVINVYRRIILGLANAIHGILG
ncbi:hypothetical protein MTO96_051090 [Rhipicephalus appendiculatus]